MLAFDTDSLAGKEYKVDFGDAIKQTVTYKKGEKFIHTYTKEGHYGIKLYDDKENLILDKPNYIDVRYPSIRPETEIVGNKGNVNHTVQFHSSTEPKELITSVVYDFGDGKHTNHWMSRK